MHHDSQNRIYSTNSNDKRGSSIFPPLLGLRILSKPRVKRYYLRANNCLVCAISNGRWMRLQLATFNKTFKTSYSLRSPEKKTSHENTTIHQTGVPHIRLLDCSCWFPSPRHSSPWPRPSPFVGSFSWGWGSQLARRRYQTVYYLLCVSATP